MVERDERKPVTPRPAASVVLMRRDRQARRALEVLLLRRTFEARFFPGTWVFPGGAVEPEDGAGSDGFRACAVRELHEEAGIELPVDEELVPFCRWITPEAIPRRFDAWFFLALAPADAPARIDGGEIIEARWLEPAAALAGADEGEISLAFPTRVQLGWLAEHASSAAALAAYRGRSPEPVVPEILDEGEDFRVVLPGIADSRDLKNLAKAVRRG